MHANRGKGPDVAALVGWLVAAMCGWQAFQMADHLRHDPGMIRGDAKAVFVTVSGLLLLALSLGLAAGALARLVGEGEPLAPPVVSLVLGVSMIGLFVAFAGWGMSLTKGPGTTAALLLVVPYLLGGLGVLVARRRRLDSSQLIRA